MGSLTKVLQDISGANEEERAQKERLELLLVAAKAKLRGYKDEINANFMNPDQVNKIQVPGHRSIRTFEQYHVATKTELSTQVKDHMDKAIDAFFSIGDKGGSTKESVKNGIQSLISMGLDGFIGSTEVGETEERIYVIVPENNAIIRADIACWKYTFDQQKLIHQSDTAIAYVLCKSVVDHKQLTLDELIYFATDALATRKTADLAPPPLPAELFGTTPDKVQENLDKVNAKLKELAKAAGPEADARKALSDFLAQDNDLAKQARIAVGPAPWQFTLDGSKKVTDVAYTRVASMDLSQPYSSSPPSLADTEAYIDELIRVWRNITSEMQGGPLTVQPQPAHANGPGVLVRPS